MNVLIVEDNPASLRRVRRLVQEAAPSAALFAFSDSGDAMNFIREGESVPDVAFLDVEMPKPDGMQLADALLLRNGRANIVIVSAYTQYQEAAFRRFVSGYLIKPIRAEDVRVQLAHLRYPPLSGGP